MNVMLDFCAKEGYFQITNTDGDWKKVVWIDGPMLCWSRKVPINYTHSRCILLILLCYRMLSFQKPLNAMLFQYAVYSVYVYSVFCHWNVVDMLLHSKAHWIWIFTIREIKMLHQMSLIERTRNVLPFKFQHHYKFKLFAITLQYRNAIDVIEHIPFYLQFFKTILNISYNFSFFSFSNNSKTFWK